MAWFGIPAFSRRKNSMIFRSFQRAVSILFLLVAIAHAEIVVLHQGSKDPHSEDWTKYRPFLDVGTFPVTNDLGLGIDAWSVEDKKGFGPPGHDGLYGVFLNKGQLKRAETRGWRFSVFMRIVKATLGKDNDSIISGVVDSTHSYVMQFGRTRDGKPIVRIITGENKGPMIEVDDPKNGYHLYELSYDPRTKSTTLFIDGVLRAKDFTGQLGGIDLDNPHDAEGNIFFGSTSNNFTSQTNYAKVQFEIASRQTEPRVLTPPPIVGGSKDSAKQDEVLSKKNDKFSIPNAEAYKASENEVREVYRDDFANLHTGDQKRALASKLLKHGIETTDDNDGRYVMFRMSQDLAVSVGDLDTALQTIDLTDQKYAVDAIAMKAEMLRKFVDMAPNRYQIKDLLPTTTELMVEAIGADRYDLASRLGKMSIPLARKKRDISTVRQVARQLEEIDALQKEYDKAQGALSVVASKPTDPDANLLLGKFYCLVKGDWDNGISMLALGNDDSLKKLAEKELAESVESEEKLRLGDDWWDLSLKEQGLKRDNALIRAQYWYQKALPNLSGLTKARVEKRLQEQIQSAPLAKAASSDADLMTEANFEKSIKKGNWRIQNGHFIFAGNRGDGMLIFPDKLPRQFRVALRVRPSGVAPSTCIAFYFHSGVEYIVQLAADGSCVIADGKDPRSDHTAKYGSVFNDQKPNAVDYEVRNGTLVVTVNGRQFLTYRDPRLGTTSSDDFSIGVVGGEWTIEAIRIAPK
jgi:hypothetical protein